jgi:polynucleotide 5'-hydroxyl-kinase GRC3/NOL9
VDRALQQTRIQSQETKRASLASIPVSPVEVSSLDSDILALESRLGLRQTRSVATETALEDAEDDQDPSYVFNIMPSGCKYVLTKGCSSESHVEFPLALPETPVITLSTFSPGDESIRELKDGILCLKLAPGEVYYSYPKLDFSNINQRLVILGQFEISVQKGRITLLGATLQPSKSRYRIYAPLSHSLPVIRCLATDINEAEVCLYQCVSGLGHLKSLSPLFGRLWNDGSGPLGQEYKTLLKLEKSTFQIVSGFDVRFRHTNAMNSFFLLVRGRRRHTCNLSFQRQSGMKLLQRFLYILVKSPHGC